MSLRQPVNQWRIERFLQQLGKQFAKPGHVYLVGGTSMVYEGLRQQSLDSQFIKRYGQLDVFHFDLYSTALSKIARGTEEDFADVLSLLQTSRLDMAELTRYFNEILPHFATASLKRDPAEFKRNFEALAAMWSTT
jgi:hypothetical protein